MILALVISEVIQEKEKLNKYKKNIFTKIYKKIRLNRCLDKLKKEKDLINISELEITYGDIAAYLNLIDIATSLNIKIQMKGDLGHTENQDTIYLHRGKYTSKELTITAKSLRNPLLSGGLASINIKTTHVHYKNENTKVRYISNFDNSIPSSKSIYSKYYEYGSIRVNYIKQSVVDTLFDDLDTFIRADDLFIKEDHNEATTATNKTTTTTNRN